MPIRIRTIVCLLMLPILLAACSAGIAEFRYYGEAFETQYAEGSRALDRLAQAERVLVRRSAKAPSGTAPFDPDAARYVLEVGDPPLTGAIRASLDSLRAYNAALTGLATGEAAAVLTGRLGDANAALSAAAQSVAAAAGLSLPGVVSLEGAIKGALPVIERLTRISDRIRFRKELLLAYPDMRALMVELREGTPAMFEVIKRSYIKPGSFIKVSEEISAADLPKLEADRKLLAGWVILIDETLLAMDKAVVAAAERRSGANLAALTEASVEIRALAETIRALRTQN